ncbi:VWA domain-containing protein [Brucepastera parasyntrophica]|uniref:VWA domain-containing protein n=1 Tax=Brucepastera parasyntrophica TaxID=2880008 RepID=UPI00210A1219|nr:VWA domain-containing protein [Brucepastera parasyntrophica]ULQ60702.1 VWA domain-containing protein [Brucepastera parasyntrophica]
MPDFSRPVFLLLILLVPLFFLLRKYGILKKIEFPLTFCDWQGMAFTWKAPFLQFASWFSVFTLIAAFVCAIIALSGPVRLRQEPIYSGRGAAIIFVIDISPSMAAYTEDGQTRIDTALRYIKEFTETRPGESFGLVAFGSEAALLIPPTIDHYVFINRLESLVPGELGDGTAIGMGLAVAAAHLIYRSSGNAYVILLTDGESNTGEINPSTAAGIYPENNIHLFVAGIGSTGETAIEYTDPNTGRRYSGFLDSDYDEKTLMDVAQKAGGTYIRARNSEMLESVFMRMGNTIPLADTSWTQSVEESLDHIFVLFTLALACGAWILRRLIMGGVL